MSGIEKKGINPKVPDERSPNKTPLNFTLFFILLLS
jgi:hypothetical protein